MRPTPRALLLAFAGLPLALLPALFGAGLWPVWMAFAGGLLLALGVDIVLALPRSQVEATLEVPPQISIGELGEAQLAIKAPEDAGALQFLIWPTLSDRFEPVQPSTIPLQAGGARVGIPLHSLRRGVGVIRRVWLQWKGPMGLVRVRKIVQLDQDVPVVTNLAPVRTLALRYFTPRESSVGLKIERYVGDGTEFESMREYVRGLDPRGMSWKQSARHRRLICQEFRAERNHAVVLAIDSGRNMSDPIAGVPKVDHAVTAGLVLAYAALRTGDRVGMFSFDAEPGPWIEPAAGAAAFPRLSHRATAIDYSEGETNFTLGLAALSARLRRRTLIVLLTDFVDTITAELMVENVMHLARKHVVIFVALSDPAWRTMAEEAPESETALYESVVASEFGRERHRVLERLRRRGVTCIDAPPAGVSTDLVNHYLDLKRREVLG